MLAHFQCFLGLSILHRALPYANALSLSGFLCSKNPYRELLVENNWVKLLIQNFLILFIIKQKTDFKHKSDGIVFWVKHRILLHLRSL